MVAAGMRFARLARNRVRVHHLIAALLLVAACSERGIAPAAQEGFHGGLAAREQAPFTGNWTVASVDGAFPPDGQPPIHLSVDSTWVVARTNCPFLGEWTYAADAGVLTLTPPPPGLVTSCARGLSEFERAFTEVLKAGAVARSVDAGLVIEREGRAITLAREPWRGGPVRLALLTPSNAGDAAASGGRLEVDGLCLYVRTPGGDRILPALQTPDARWDLAKGVLNVGGKSFALGSRVQLGGSMWLGSEPPPWRQAPDPACDQSRIWVAISLEAETAAVTEPAAEAGPPSAGPRGPDPSSLPGSVAAVALPFLAVNTVDALLPMGRARGLLSVEKDCVVFILRGQRYAPIWPIGTRLSETGQQVLGPDGQVFDLGEEATFDGASFSLKNESMRLERPIPGRCPRATYAINL